MNISISNIKNMKANVLNTAYVAIMLFYHNLTTQSYLYTPTSRLIGATSIAETIQFKQINLLYSGYNTVLKPTNLNISLILTYNITTSDYIVVTFPPELMDPFVYTNYSCINCIPQIFYVSRILRIYPIQNITNGTLINFNIVNFPTSPYAINSQNI